MADKTSMESWAIKAWYFLIPLFVLIIVWRLYDWSQGRDDFFGIFSPLGMIFVGLASLAGRQNRPLHYFFLAVGLISVTVGLVSLFMR